MAADINQFTVPTVDESRSRFLDTMETGMRQRGIADPNVSNNSHWWVLGQSYANELAPIGANGMISADAMSVATATGQDLLDACARYGNRLRPAAGSFGAVVFNVTAPSLVATGAQLTDSNGLSYEVAVGGVYPNGNSIPIRALGLGAATNLPAGSSLQWRSAPAFSAPTALVDIGGLVNGIDAETPENLRQRTLDKIRNSPGNGNPQHLIETALASSPSVQGVFVNPAIQGPGTVHIAVTAAPTATNVSREIVPALMTGTINPYIQGTLPSGVAYVVVTTVNDVQTEASICLSLPAAVTASPAGPGGGWLDGTPWPTVNLTSSWAAPVSVVTTTTQFTVLSTASAPTPGVTQVAWFSYAEKKLYKATVIAVTGSTPNWAITIDTPFTGIYTGAFIFPQSANQDLYIAALLAGYELMGPGEKSANASALIRGFRHPIPSQSWPYSLGPELLRAITDSSTEVLSAQYAFRFDGVVSINGSSGLLTPQIPVAITDPPNIFIPKNVAFYPVP